MKKIPSLPVLRIILLSSVLLASCGPQKHLYRFHVTRYYPIESYNENSLDSVILVYEAESEVDSSELLEYDVNRLKELASKRLLSIDFRDSGIVLQKFTKWEDDIKKLNHRISTESPNDIIKIKSMSYYGKSSAYDSTLVNDAEKFEKFLKKKKDENTAGAILGVLAVLGIMVLIALSNFSTFGGGFPN